MKKRVSALIITLSLLGAMAVATAQAQSGEKFVVNIPFCFTVGEKTLPAGDYRVETLSFGGAHLYSKLMIRSTDGQTSKIVATLPVRAGALPEESKLVFRRYGEQYFLAQVWAVGTDTGWEFRQSRAEKRLARTGVKRQEVPILTHP